MQSGFYTRCVGWGHVAAFIGVVACLLAGCGVQGESGTPTAAEERAVVGTTDATTTPTYGGPENIAPNPSFEGGTRYWGSWGNAKIEAVATDAKDGRAAAKVSPTDVAPYGIESDPLVGYPERGDTYALSVWLRSDRPKTAVVRVDENGGRFEPQTVAEREVRIGRKWRELSVEGKIRRDDRLNVNAYVFVLRSIGRRDAFFVDAVTFVRKTGGGA